jgi:tRNA A-37 threonylcarbamoyl transferase component Bud32
MTINKVRGLAVGIIEAIESVHNDNIAHTQINARNIVVVRGVFKLTNFGHAVFNPSRELRFEDYNSFGRTLAVLAESMMLDSLLLKK